MSIQNISRSKISLVATLANRKFRRKEGLFVVEGRKCVADTIGKYQLEFIAAKPEWIEYHNIGQTVPEEKVFLTDDDEMKKMSTLVTPSDVLAVYRLPQSTPISEILETPLEPGFYLMLDSIQDPGNLGTIIRTAHWFGMKRIFASPMTADIYNPKAIQSSMGSMSTCRFLWNTISICRSSDWISTDATSSPPHCLTADLSYWATRATACRPDYARRSTCA